MWLVAKPGLHSRFRLCKRVSAAALGSAFTERSEPSASAGGAEFSRTELDCLSVQERSMQGQTQAVTWMKRVLQWQA